MKKHLSTIILALVFCIGLSLLLYPTVADWWNRQTQGYAIAAYTEQIVNLGLDQTEELWNEAHAYNEKLARNGIGFDMSEEETEEYYNTFNVGGTSMIGHIDIPKLNCMLPIYHGTDEAVLSAGVGHLAGTSLPVGGLSTHTVLTGHRGLPSAKLFSELDQLDIGDKFMLSILDDTLTYQVEDITIIIPSDLDFMKIIPGKDLCTLVTCTPYGINTHRLLVRGRRIGTAYDPKEAHVMAEALLIDSMLVAPVVAAPILLVLFIWLLFPGKERRRKR